MASKMLKKEEELQLARSWKDKGDQAARAKLLQSYQPLVRSIASKHMRNGLQREDLIQEGNIGFLAGLDNFNPDLGHSVGTLARFHIAARMQIYISEFNGVLRLPNSRRIKGLLTKCIGGIKQAESHLGREITNVEKEKICAQAGFTYAEVQDYEMVMRPSQSLSTPKGTEDEPGFEIADDHSQTAIEAQSQIDASGVLSQVLATMPERTQHVLMRRHMSDSFVSLEEVAKELELSRERVRKIEIEGLSILKDKLIQMGLTSFDDIF